MIRVTPNPRPDSRGVLRVNPADFAGFRFVGVKARMGAGKTHAIREYLHGQRGVAIVPLRALEAAWAADVPGMISASVVWTEETARDRAGRYQRARERLADVPLACTTLHKFVRHHFAERDPSRDVIVIDEFESVLPELATGQTCARHRADWWNTLMVALRHARQIICLDAALDPQLVARVARAAGIPDSEVGFVEYAPDVGPRRGLYQLVEDRDALMEQLSVALGRGPTFYGTTSSSDAEAVQLAFGHFDPVTVTKSSRKSPRAAEFVRTRGRVGGRPVRLAVCSPAVASGLSLDTDEDGQAAYRSSVIHMRAGGPGLPDVDVAMQITGRPRGESRMLLYCQIASPAEVPSEAVLRQRMILRFDETGRCRRGPYGLPGWDDLVDTAVFVQRRVMLRHAAGVEYVRERLRDEGWVEGDPIARLHPDGGLAAYIHEQARKAAVELLVEVPALPVEHPRHPGHTTPVDTAAARQALDDWRGELVVIAQACKAEVQAAEWAATRKARIAHALGVSPRGLDRQLLELEVNLAHRGGVLHHLRQIMARHEDAHGQALAIDRYAMGLDPITGKVRMEPYFAADAVKPTMVPAEPCTPVDAPAAVAAHDLRLECLEAGGFSLDRWRADQDGIGRLFLTGDEVDRIQAEVTRRGEDAERLGIVRSATGGDTRRNALTLLGWYGFVRRDSSAERKSDQRRKKKDGTPLPWRVGLSSAVEDALRRLAEQRRAAEKAAERLRAEMGLEDVCAVAK